MKRLAVIAACVALLPAALVAAGFSSAAEQGLKAYREHEFDKAIEACKESKDLQSRLVLGLSYAEKNALYRNKADKVQAGMYLRILEVDVKISDAKTLEKFLNVEGNKEGNEAATKLLKKAFASPRTPEDVLLMAEFLDPARGVEANGLALDGILRRIKPVREYVSKGGSLPDADRALFTDEKLIKPLVAMLAQKKTAGDAEKCLVLIEEPSLRYLEVGELSEAQADAVLAVKKAIAARIKKYAESTWFSAYGR